MAYSRGPSRWVGEVCWSDVSHENEFGYGACVAEARGFEAIMCVDWFQLTLDFGGQLG